MHTRFAEAPCNFSFVSMCGSEKNCRELDILNSILSWSSGDCWTLKALSHYTNSWGIAGVYWSGLFTLQTKFLENSFFLGNVQPCSGVGLKEKTVGFCVERGFERGLVTQVRI